MVYFLFLWFQMKLEVLNYVSVEDLKNVRLVDQDWNPAATALLEKTAPLSLNDECLDQILSNNEGASVGFKAFKLHFDPMTLEKGAFEAWGAKVIRVLGTKVAGEVEHLTLSKLKTAKLNPRIEFLKQLFSTCPSLTGLSFVNTNAFDRHAPAEVLPQQLHCKTVDWTGMNAG